jgi:quinol monooxygenase YgiN
MITIVAATYIEWDSREEFIKLAAQTVEESLKEDGCIAYSCAEDIREPGTFRWIEVWRDLEAFNAHAEAVHHRDFLSAVGTPGGPQRSASPEGIFFDARALTPEERDDMGFSPHSRPATI